MRKMTCGMKATIAAVANATILLSALGSFEFKHS